MDKENYILSPMNMSSKKEYRIAYLLFKKLCLKKYDNNHGCQIKEFSNIIIKKCRHEGIHLSEDEMRLTDG